MNILHLSNTPISGAPYRLMQVQRQGGIDARLISHRATFDYHTNVHFPHDIILQSYRSNVEKRKETDFDRNEVFDLFNRADVLHFHNDIHNQYIFRLYPELFNFTKNTPTFIQYHSGRNSLKYVERDLKSNFLAKCLVVAQYQARHFPEAQIVPNAIPISDEHYLPVDRNNSPPIITYSPSNKNLSGWNNKGYATTMQTFREIGKDAGTLVLTDTPHEECLQRKQIADIGIDEVVTGSYHLSTLEALSMGQVAICGLDKECEKTLSEYTGTSEHPIVVSSPNTLTKTLRNLISDREHLRDLQIKSRKFMEDYWSQERINKWFKAIYNGETP